MHLSLIAIPLILENFPTFSFSFEGTNSKEQHWNVARSPYKLPTFSPHISCNKQSANQLSILIIITRCKQPVYLCSLHQSPEQKDKEKDEKTQTIYVTFCLDWNILHHEMWNKKLHFALSIYICLYMTSVLHETELRSPWRCARKKKGCIGVGDLSSAMCHEFNGGSLQLYLPRDTHLSKPVPNGTFS